MSVRRRRRRPLVVGVGNEQRGDDAVGLLVARRLRSLGAPVDVCEWHGDATGLLDVWDGAGTCVVVDAVHGASPGEVRRVDPGAAVPTHAVGSHGVSVATAVALARALGRAPRRLVLVGVGGARFGLGDPVSPAVQQAVDAAARLVLAEAR